MKKFIINKILNYIYEHKEYTDIEKDMIKYGISNLYLQISKMIVITCIAIILNIVIPYLLFIFFYNIIRATSFGLHAKKSYQCWISSMIFFIGLPFISKYIVINNLVKTSLLIFVIIYMAIYSPADTAKRPIVSINRRLFYKYASTLISIVYSVICLYIKDQMVSNIILFSLTLQCIIISPITYKIFGMTYDNYKEYKREEELVCLQES